MSSKGSRGSTDISSADIDKAVHLRETGNHEQAIALLHELLQRAPDNPDLNYQMAWCMDNLGREQEAVSFYARAIENNLNRDDLQGAYLGLGSTYRALGKYHQSRETLLAAMAEFPHNNEFKVFLALTLYNLKDHREATRLLLTTLCETTSDANIRQYEKALLFYSDKLDRTW